VGADQPELHEADWLAYPYGISRWGTVISHLAFAHHFLFPAPLSLRRAGGLRPSVHGHSHNAFAARRGFYYAPGLPFIEDLLPAGAYSVRRRQVPLPDSAGAVAQATRVVRLR
jgi:hypothetical protein